MAKQLKVKSNLKAGTSCAEHQAEYDKFKAVRDKYPPDGPVYKFYDTRTLPNIAARAAADGCTVS